MWTKAGHDPSKILMKLLQMKRVYEIQLSWKFQYKLITSSKVITPESWHGKLKIDKTRGQAAWKHFWVSIIFYELHLKFGNLLHCFCAQRALRSAKFQDFEIFWKSIIACYDTIKTLNLKLFCWLSISHQNQNFKITVKVIPFRHPHTTHRHNIFI